MPPVCPTGGGVIPTLVLWWDIGAEYTGSRTGRLALKALFQFDYTCVLTRSGRTILDLPLQIKSLGRTEPIIFSCDETGAPLNGFAQGRDNVYLRGLNFPSGCPMRIHITRDRGTWSAGDRLEDVLDKELVIRPEGDGGDFIVLVWERHRTDIGSYDLMVTSGSNHNVLTHESLIDSIHGAGFAVFPASVPGARLEAELTCQAPPRDPITGTVFGLPSPLYRDSFAPAEEIWVAAPPRFETQADAGGQGRLYVVNNRTEAEWLDGTPLEDVSSDGYETTMPQPGSGGVHYTRVWSEPAPRTEGYDVVVDFEPFGIYNEGSDIINRQDSVSGGDIAVPETWILLESVSYNHNTASNTSDAINIRWNKNVDVTVPEWQSVPHTFTLKPYRCAYGPINPAAYITGRSITVKAVFSCSTDVTGAKLRAADGYFGQLGNVDQQTISFSGGTSGTVTFQVSDPTPDQIMSFYQDWHWYCADINGAGSGEETIGVSISKIYTVLAQPQSPWATSGQSEPWVDGLKKSVAWAWGKTTPEGAAGEIAQELFSNAGGLYDIYWGAAHYGYPNLNLTSFLNNMPSVGTVNCYDMGRSLVSFANLVGCGLNYRYSSPFGYLNCINAIGRGWTNNPFYANSYYDSNPIVNGDWGSSQGRSGFGNHAFGAISDDIFDACLTADTDSDPDYGPPFTETWMIDEPWTGYKSKVVDNYPSTSTGFPSSPSFTVY